MSHNDKTAAPRSALAQDLIVTAGGFIASTATAWMLYAMERWWDFSLYSLMVWFVLPAGALIAGMGAAAGYYAGARIADSRPTRLLLVNMVLVSASTFFAIHWLRYDGYFASRGLGDRVSFWRYLDEVTTHQSMILRTHGARVGDTGELGLLGYGVAALQILGFAMGGFIVYGALAKLPFCDRCARYLAKRGAQKRFADTPDSFETMVHSLVARWNQGDLQGALDLHRRWGQAKLSKTCRVLSTFEHKQCPGCRVNWLRYSAQRFDGQHWKAVPGLDFARMHDGNLSA